MTTTAGKPQTGKPETLVYRQVSFGLEAFDALKQYQRHIERTEARRVTNSEVLDRLILSHPET